LETKQGLKVGWGAREVEMNRDVARGKQMQMQMQQCVCSCRFVSSCGQKRKKENKLKEAQRQKWIGGGKKLMKKQEAERQNY